MKKKEKKEKKYIAPNEASLGRWIGTLVAGVAIGYGLCLFLIPYALNHLGENPDGTSTLVGTSMGMSSYQFVLHMAFVALFWGLVISLKAVGKTSLKDFVLGVGGKINWKECLTILGLYLAGFVLAYLPLVGYIRPREVNAGDFALMTVFMLLTVWEQSTWEELVFRGLLIRWACKNEIGFTKKSYIVAIVTSVAFALGHAQNPEVTSQGGIQVLLALTSYGITGFLFFFVSMYFGNLMPGIIVHWINNFVLSTVISAEVSVVDVPTLLMDTSPHSGAVMMISNLIPWLPLMVYICLDYRKKKKAAAAC